jgi:hypothetical protein
MNTIDMNSKKTISLYLYDGNPNGRWNCEISNWSGIAYKIPRNQIKNEKRKELESPGVYFLFGWNETEDKPSIYVGQAEKPIGRLNIHLRKLNDEHPDNEYSWNEVIVLVRKEPKLDNADIRYLEYRFHSIAKEIGRYKVDNENTPSEPTLSESKKEELKEFISYAKILVNVLGHKVFNEYVEKSPNKKTIFCLSVGGCDAKGTPTSEGFVLLKGSKISEKTAKSLPDGVRNRVEESRKNGLIEGNILKEDMLFSSSSSAAGFASGHSISGPRRWKTIDGKTLKSFEMGEDKETKAKKT